MICGMRLPRFDSPGIFLDLPSSDNPPLAAESIFNLACRAISLEWKGAEGKADEARVRWLQLVAYQCLGHLLDHDLEFLIDGRLRGFDRYSRGNEEKANPFQRGLVAIFAHEKPHHSPTAQLRSRVSKRLMYAHRHYVPHEFLRGFLHQVGDGGLKEKLKSGAVEPGFEEWVVEKRLTDSRPDSRGRYPSEIEKAVSGLRKMLPIMEQSEGRIVAARTRRTEN